MDPYKITIDSWNKVASAYNDNFMDLEMYNESYDFFCDAINNESAKIFEIGCGPGNITKYLITKHPGYQIKAVDVAPSMIDIAVKNNPGVSFEVQDARMIEVGNKFYDGIMCGFCIPYLSKEDCSALIHKCTLLLEKNGVLYLSCIKGDHIHSGYETGSVPDAGMFVYYYDEIFLTKLLRQNNFNVLFTQSIPYQKKNMEVLDQLIMVAKKN